MTLYVPFHLRQITHGPFLRKIYWKIKCLTRLIVQKIRIWTNRSSSTFGQADLRISSLSPILSLNLSLFPHYCRYGPYPLLYPNYPHHQVTLYFRSQRGAHVEIMHLNDIYHVYVIFTCTNCVYVYVKYFRKLISTTWTIHTQVNGEKRKLWIAFANAPN